MCEKRRPYAKSWLNKLHNSSVRNGSTNCRCTKGLEEQGLHDQENYELMKEIQAASAQQSWDDWVLWEAMQDRPPSPKRQRLAMHMRV